jgi:NAD(P)-dependent dehydrogenase (short-subunit alcohol dehydrogenase family)
MNLENQGIPMTTSVSSMKGRVCLVTGANSGIGRETALGLAKAGATVLAVCRDRSKGEVAVAEIKKASGSKNVSLFTADLTSIGEMRTLHADVKEKFGYVDVLVNNAGALFSERKTTDDGLEMTFATNHLNYFVMSHLFLDLLKKSAAEAKSPARIINVASEAHRSIRAETIDWQCETGEYKPFEVYGLSKLANILFTRELSARLNPAEITVNSLHPGVVRTSFGTQGNWGWMGTLFNLARPLFLTPEKGARTSLYLASEAEISQLTGCYFKNCSQSKPSALAFNDRMGKNLWEVSKRITGMG